jgi:anti-anti-sigma factor
VGRQHRTWDLDTVAERVPGGIVVTARGRIGSVTADSFAQAVARARTEAASIVIDLSSVDYISGPGVAVLRQASSNGGRIIICGLKEPVRITLELAQVLSDVVVKDNRQAAIESL